MNTPHKNKKYFACGIDNGYGSYKLMIEDCPFIPIPSYLSEEIMDDVPGRVTYKGRSYTVGKSALRCNKTFQRNVDIDGSKIEYAHQMLLGALSHQEPRREWHLYAVASIHDRENFGASLKKKLDGTFNCKLAGQETVVTVEVLGIIPEGVGALKCFDPAADQSVLDFGNGTTLFSRYSNGKKIAHEPENTGVEKLIDIISIAMKRQLHGHHGDSHLIRQGLEQGNLSYGRSDSFKDIYEDCLREWYEKHLKKTMRLALDAYNQGDEVLCIGGGALLPGFSEKLIKRGFVIHPMPVEANAKGMMMLAKEKAAQKEKTAQKTKGGCG